MGWHPVHQAIGQAGRQAHPPSQHEHKILGVLWQGSCKAPRSQKHKRGEEGRSGGGFFWVFSFFTRKQAPRSGEGTSLLYARSSSPYIFLQPCERLHHNGEGGREASVMCRRSIRLSFRPSVCCRSRRSVARASGSRGTDMPSALWCHPAPTRHPRPTLLVALGVKKQGMRGSKNLTSICVFCPNVGTLAFVSFRPPFPVLRPRNLIAFCSSSLRPPSLPDGFRTRRRRERDGGGGG